MTVYATLDHSDTGLHFYREGALFERFESRADASAWLLKQAEDMYDDLEADERLGVIELGPSDCWLKWPKYKPFTPFDADDHGLDFGDVRRIPSGAHPGNQYHDWLEVSAPVLGVVVKEEGE